MQIVYNYKLLLLFPNGQKCFLSFFDLLFLSSIWFFSYFIFIFFLFLFLIFYEVFFFLFFFSSWHYITFRAAHIRISVKSKNWTTKWAMNWVYSYMCSILPLLYKYKDMITTTTTISTKWNENNHNNANNNVASRELFWIQITPSN